MSPDRIIRSSRRRFLAGFGAGAGVVSLAGCLGVRLPGSVGRPDLSVYVGAYHWGFVMLDEAGTERGSMVLDPGTRVRIVAFDTGADGAIEQLPRAVRGNLPDHEALEARNEERIPDPPSGDTHEALEDANDRYPDHSVAVMPSGANHMRGGMMLHPGAPPRRVPAGDGRARGGRARRLHAQLPDLLRVRAPVHGTGRGVRGSVGPDRRSRPTTIDSISRQAAYCSAKRTRSGARRLRRLPRSSP